MTTIRSTFYQDPAHALLNYRTSSNIDWRLIRAGIQESVQHPYVISAEQGQSYKQLNTDVHNATWNEWAKTLNGSSPYASNDLLPTAWTKFLELLNTSTKHNDNSIIDNRTRVLHHDLRFKPLGELKLLYVANGTYNIVYKASRESEKEMHRFPPNIRHKLHEVVFRVPIDNDSVTVLPVSRTAKEIVNMIEAANGGFGPPVYAGIAQIVGNGVDAKVSAASEGKCKLYVISKNLNATLQNVFYSYTSSLPSHREQLNWIMNMLRDVVFAYSIRRMIHLDASLSNFMVSSAKTGGEPIAQVRNLYAIDLDPLLYRFVSVNSDDAENSSWRCIWLYNILFISCQIKAYATEQIFGKWLNQEVHMNGKSLRILIQEMTMIPMGPDCAWINEIIWDGPVQDYQYSDKDIMNTSIDTIKNELKLICMHYFIKVPKASSPDDLRKQNTARYFERTLDYKERLVTIMYNFLSIDHLDQQAPSKWPKLS